MEHIVAVGAGRMGRGIAHVMAYSGFTVTLVDVKDRSVAESQRVREEALAEITNNLRSLASFEVVSDTDVETIMRRISFASRDEASAALSTADFVFEGVPEVMTAKAAVLGLICDACNEGAIIASTTSTFSAETLADYVTNPSRFANAHWLNPAFLIPIVEVSPTTRTSQDTIDGLLSLLERAGKMPVQCKATPGFIIPRIQALAMNEAARLVEDGVASAEDIDKATRYGFGVRFAILGLLEFIDYGGGDILHYASQYMSSALDSERHVAPEIIGTMMENNQTGLRDGKGFYDYTNCDVDEYQKETLRKLVDLLAHMNLIPPPHGASAVSSPRKP